MPGRGFAMPVERYSKNTVRDVVHIDQLRIQLGQDEPLPEESTEPGVPAVDAGAVVPALPEEPVATTPETTEPPRARFDIPRKD